MNINTRIFFRIVDMLCILIALAVSSWWMLPPELEIFADYTGASTFTLVTFFVCFYMFDCYALLDQEQLKDSIIRVLVAVVVGIVGTGFIFYTFEHWRFPRLMFVLQMVITLVLTLGWRVIYARFGKRISSRHERVIFLGAAMAARARRVLNEYSPLVEIVGYAGEPGADEHAGPFLCTPSEVLETAKAKGADKILVLDSFYLDDELAKKLFEAKIHGLKVEDMRSLYERLASRLPIDLIADEWLLLEDGFNLNSDGILRRVKRIFDVGFAVTLFLVTLPILLPVVLFIRLDSKGPVIYTQKRVGLGGKEFTVYKLRSMRPDAEQGGAVWAAKGDPRVTRIGKFIRKTRIDELPQLFNVLKGDMSVIGPRPERMEFVQELEQVLPYYAVRHTVKPGITGWAQVKYPYGASIEDARYKLEYDLYYIKNLSLLLELKIILKTIGVVLIPTGAR